MEKNRELASRVLKYVIANPQSHDQNSWEDLTTTLKINSAISSVINDPVNPLVYSVSLSDDVITSIVSSTNISCPTTACLAGWTVFIVEGVEGMVKCELGERSPSSEQDFATRAAALLGVPLTEISEIFWITPFEDSTGCECCDDKDAKGLSTVEAANKEAIYEFACLFELDPDTGEML